LALGARVLGFEVSVMADDPSSRPPAATPHPVEALARQHYEPLLRFATRLCGEPVEAKDLVQDTFERALRRYDTFDPAMSARAWLYSILHNAFIDRCRRRVKTVSTESFDPPAPPAVEDEPAPPAWSRISTEQLRVAVDALAPDFREVYRKHAIDGRSYRDISVELGIPENTVGTRLARAREKLRRILVEMTSETEAAV
jgi:RNA polymerase sigma-70 factor (ECF subfamily)